LSKLVDKLENLGQSAPAKLGFGRAAARDKTPVLLVVGRTTDPSAREGLADVYLVPSSGLTEEDKVTLWGVTASDGASIDLPALKEKGCQFMMIESEKIPAGVLADEDMDKGLAVSAGLSEQRVRAIEDGPFEFLVLKPQNLAWPLDVGSMLDLQEVVSNFSKHMFLEPGALPGKDDLEVLKQMPVSGIVVDLDSIPAEEVRSLREAIAKLEPRKQKTDRRPLIPTSGQAPAPSSGDDFDDDDDDWDE
jgi:hypothetical protein